MNNAEKIIAKYLGEYVSLSKKDTIRFSIDCDNNFMICDYNTPMGYIKEMYIEQEDIYRTFLVLTMENYKSQPSWKLHKRALAKAANAQGIYVIFVNQLDIGFGIDPPSKSTTVDVYYDKLLELYKLSPLKTNTCLMFLEDDTTTDIFYAFDQVIDDEDLTALDILNMWFNSIQGIKCSLILSLKESNVHDLKIAMNMSDNIAYGHLSINYKECDEYIELTNDIFNHKYTCNDRPVKYNYIGYNKIDKYLEKEKSK